MLPEWAEVGEHLHMDYIQDYMVLSQERELMDYEFATDSLLIY